MILHKLPVIFKFQTRLYTFLIFKIKSRSILGEDIFLSMDNCQLSIVNYLIWFKIFKSPNLPLQQTLVAAVALRLVRQNHLINH
jgi:hypothetical protein